MGLEKNGISAEKLGISRGKAIADIGYHEPKEVDYALQLRWL